MAEKNDNLESSKKIPPPKEGAQEELPSVRTFSDSAAHEFREGIGAMTKGSPGAENVLPPLVVDAETARTLEKIDSSGQSFEIPSGGGPYQAIREKIPESMISDHDLSKASKVVRDERMAGHNLKTGEQVPTGQAYSDQDLAAENRAELRKDLNLPYTASDSQVHSVMSANNLGVLRQENGLPANASFDQIQAKMAADNLSVLRQENGLPANASFDQIQAKMAADNLSVLRQENGLPADASFDQIEAKMAERLSKQLDQETKPVNEKPQ